jgi:hypothetical protein
MVMSRDKRRALRLLAAAPNGATEAIMLAHGFTVEMLGRLVLDGHATASATTNVPIVVPSATLLHAPAVDYRVYGCSRHYGSDRWQ